MPVNETEVAAYLDELGLSQAIRDNVLAEFKTNDKAATQFVGGRLRHADYTRKAQALADEKKAITDQANTQIQQYATSLATAEGRINKIMTDFQGSEISRATAEARLRGVKEKYNLSDDEIPAVTTQAAARTSAEANPIDIDARLKSFQEDLMKNIRSEMSAVPDLNALQFDIVRRHKELTGKDITSTELRELNKEAATKGQSLMGTWDQKYEISKLQVERDNTALIARERTKWEDEEKAKRSNEAMAQATSSRTDPKFTASSSVLTREYGNRGDVVSTQTQDPASRSAADKSPVPVAKTAVARNSMSGAERAAGKWIERQGNGLLGKPLA